MLRPVVMMSDQISSDTTYTSYFVQLHGLSISHFSHTLPVGCGGEQKMAAWIFWVLSFSSMSSKSIRHTTVLILLEIAVYYVVAVVDKAVGEADICGLVYQYLVSPLEQNTFSAEMTPPSTPFS